MSTYNIKVVTSNIKYAGTNSKVYIELIGRNERSGVVFLESSSTNRNKFEQGQTDEFQIKCKNVGTLTKIRIGHNNAGISAGWHLKEVIVESLLDGRRWLCECNNWLAKDESDGKIERELPAIEMKPSNNKMDSFDNFSIKNSQYSSNKYAEKCVYKINVTTSNISSAGTNANVFIQLIGRKSSTDKFFLKSSQKDPFEKGKTDTFEIESLDLGDIKKIIIGHDNKGLKAGWHLKEVIIESLLDGRRWLCECNNWLAKGEGDGKIERELTAIEIRPSADKNQIKNQYSKYSEKCIYKIIVTTSNLHSAGTNANVYIQIFGRNSSTDKIALKSSQKDLFEKGKTDTFEIECLDLGDIKRIRIGHDNKGLKAGWHLKEVIIESLLDGRRWLCECNNWLAKDEGDGKIERELPAIEIRPNKANRFENCIYKIYVTTSNINLAGTNANVYIQIFGRHSNTDKILLKSSNLHKNPFEKGNIDYFEVDALDVGNIRMIKIGHDNKGTAPGWHLKEVVIQKLDGPTWQFPCNRWLDRKEDDGLIERELFPIDHEPNKHQHNRDEEKGYIINVYTGNLPGAGTDANVYLTLFGEHGESPEIHLRESETHRDMFERDHMDRFYVNLDERDEIGELIAIRIRHDNTGRKPEWFLDRVEIVEADTKNKFVFECKNWLASKKYDSKIDRIIKEKKQLEKEKAKADEMKQKYVKRKKQYFIKFYSKEKKTNPIEDMSLSIRLFGDLNQSKYFKYLKSITHETKFCKNQIDLFVVETEDLGTLYALELKMRSVLQEIENNIGLEKIEVTVENMKFYFFFDSYITADKGPNKLRIIVLENNAQFL